VPAHRIGWAALVVALAACSSSSNKAAPHDSGQDAASDADSASASASDGSEAGPVDGTEAASEVCTHDGCIVPLADANAACGPSLYARANDCPGVTVTEGLCGGFTHLVVQTPGPAEDCYYDPATGAPVGAVLRSDAGFTKIAGHVPSENCPAPLTVVCDHGQIVGHGGDDAGGDARSDGGDAAD
jgi:hypothetical protein